MEDLKEIMEIAIKAATEAGKHALKCLEGHVEISHKSGFNDLVTNADKSCEKMIIDIIKGSFPSHSILAEESGEAGGPGPCRWVIDPIDGTTNFAHGFPFFCSSIAVEVDKDIKVGVVYNPSLDELFSAQHGAGAFLNGKKITVSDIGKLNDSLIATGFAYRVSGEVVSLDRFGRMLDVAQDMRRAGSAALDLCYVACGRFDGFWEIGLCPWDTAAGKLILKEAGGTVSKLDGAEFDIYDKEIVATNGKIHDETLSVLHG